jgi:hypothetical protein
MYFPFSPLWFSGAGFLFGSRENGKIDIFPAYWRESPNSASAMFNFFRKNRSNGQAQPPALQMVDINGEPLAEGDWVESLRYDLGTCRIVAGEHGLEYESVDNGKRVSYLRMVDAATTFQKVRRIDKPAG